MVGVDALDTGVGAVLSQRMAEDNKMHHCAFFSGEELQRGQQVTTRVVLALQEWHHWLEGAEVPFIVWTDHKNLP